MSDRNWDEELADPTKWPTEDEVQLLHCTLDNEPVGNKFFFFVIFLNQCV